MGHSISEMVRQQGVLRYTASRVYQEYMDGGQKTSDSANCKGQLALTVYGVQSVNGLCNARFTFWVLEAVDLREYHCSMLAIGLPVLPGQESPETRV
ncbi:hypothetical protein TNCV_3897361 [Trichonephila clavipes]|nr:hypothetical protein TNCV_3897361 [Trichonephila clavipes]